MTRAVCSYQKINDQKEMVTACQALFDPTLFVVYISIISAEFC
eukprot:UN12483